MSGECGEWASDTIPDGWHWRSFELVFDEVTDSSRKLQQKSYARSGEFPVIDQGEEFIGGYTDNAALVHLREPPFIIFGDHTRCVKYIDFPFVQGADGVRVLKPKADISARYIYYAMRTIVLPDKGYSRHMKFLRASSFPICPWDEQLRVVAKLDSMLMHSQRARAELEHASLLIDRFDKAIFSKAFIGTLVSPESIESSGPRKMEPSLEEGPRDGGRKRVPA